jgi:hypothetical protein
MKSHFIKLCTVFFCVSFITINSYSQSNLDKPTAYISIQVFVGQHGISFKNYHNSKGLSFGFNLSLGLYLINNNTYHGGLQFTLLEGASYEKNRRQISEDFKLVNPNYDKHIIFKFTQFRSANIGWFNQFDINNSSIFHRLGFGIFGTTEKDQLFDFSMHNTLGVILNKDNNTNFLIGISHDAQIGIGNPNYSMKNLVLTFGGFGDF